MKEIPTMPPVKCKPWCEYQDGHPDQIIREDQVCFSVQYKLPLLHRQVPEEVPMEWNFAATFVGQEPGQDPYVHIGMVDSPGLLLTVDESVALALALLRQAEQIRFGVDPHSRVGVRP